MNTNNYRILILWLRAYPMDPTGILAGEEGTTVRRAGYLAQNGYNVTTMLTLACPPCKYHGVRYIDAKDWHHVISNLREIRKHWDIVYCFDGAVRLLRETYLMPYLKSSRLRILTLHWWPAPNRKRIKLINRYTDVVICVSKSLARLCAKSGINAKKIRVVYNGVDQQIFYPHPFARNMKRIVFAGALIPKKGIDTLLIAFNLVKEKIPNVELIVCGSADFHNKYEDWFNELPIPSDGSMQLRGKLSQSKLAQEFSQAGLAVFPSSKKHCIEGFGKVSIEAQACGCPVIVSDNGGFPETVIDGVTGRVCPADNPKALAEVMVELLSAPDQLKAMGAEAVKHVQRNFLWEETLKPLKDIIEQGVKVNLLKRQITYAERLTRLVLEKVAARISRIYKS